MARTANKIINNYRADILRWHKSGMSDAEVAKKLNGASGITTIEAPEIRHHLNQWQSSAKLLQRSWT